MNKIALAGRLARNPELRSTSSGKSVLQFSLAEDIPNKEPMFHNIVAWEGKAETISKWCKQGDQLLIIGSLRYREYVDKNKERKFITEILLDTFEFGAKKKGDADIFETPSEEISIDELPF